MLNRIAASPVNNIELELNFSRWLEETGKHGQGHAQNSIDAHLSDLRQFITWFELHNGETFAPAKTVSMDLRSYFHFSIDVQHTAPTTWNRRRASLALFFQFCSANGLVAANPFMGVPRMEVTQLAPRSMIKTDYLRFMRRVEQAVNLAASDHQHFVAIRNRAIIALMVYAGLREGEVCALRPSDLLLSDRKGTIFIRDGKGNKSGKAFIGCEGRLALREWLMIRPGSELLFDGLSARQIQRVVAAIAAQAGFGSIEIEYAGKLIKKSPITPHSLRHTFVYNVLEETGSMATAQKLARHARIDQTLAYGQPHEEDLQAATEHLGS